MKRKLYLGAMIGVLLSAAPLMGQTTLDLVEAQRLTYALIDRGQPGAALELIETLQTQDHNQTAILYIARSRAQRALGDTDNAIASGRTAFGLAQSDTEKFLAARATAQALASADRRTQAQFWLRRASQFAPSESAANSNRNDFNYVRSRNPLSYSIEFSMAPTNNINNAPTDNSINIGGIILRDPTAVPISGLDFKIHADLSYRLPATQTRQMALGVAYDARRIRLGPEATTIDPTLQASDLANDRLTLDWSARYLVADGGAAIDTSVAAFATWVAGNHIQNGITATLDYGWAIKNSTLRFSTSVTALDRLDRPIRSAQIWTIGTGWTGPIGDAGIMRVDLSYSKTDSESLAVAQRSFTVNTAYDLPDPILGADVSLGLLYRHAEFDEALYGPDSRTDSVIKATMIADLTTVEYFGFIPVLELSHERTVSNITSFDTESSSVSVSFRSSF